jgi:hypothetical protein
MPMPVYFDDLDGGNPRLIPGCALAAVAAAAIAVGVALLGAGRNEAPDAPSRSDPKR